MKISVTLALSNLQHYLFPNLSRLPLTSEMDEFQVREIVEKVLVEKSPSVIKLVLGEMLGVNKITTQQRQWYPAKEAIVFLELDSEDDLHRPRRDNRLKEGIHYRQTNSPDAGVPRFQYHVGNMKQWLQRPAAKR